MAGHNQNLQQVIQNQEVLLAQNFSKLSTLVLALTCLGVMAKCVTKLKCIKIIYISELSLHSRTDLLNITVIAS